VRNYVKSIKLFCDLTDLPVAWKKITRGLPRGRRYADDRISTLEELEQSTARISELVGAIKTYSYMDKARIQNVDVHEGNESTLTILHHKIKNGIENIREYDPLLPQITVYGSELNQV
jgi:nitrogen-specific signal transduction histidine kinase